MSSHLTPNSSTKSPTSCMPFPRSNYSRRTHIKSSKPCLFPIHFQEGKPVVFIQDNLQSCPTRRLRHHKIFNFGASFVVCTNSIIVTSSDSTMEESFRSPNFFLDFPVPLSPSFEKKNRPRFFCGDQHLEFSTQSFLHEIIPSAVDALPERCPSSATKFKLRIPRVPSPTHQ